MSRLYKCIPYQQLVDGETLVVFYGVHALHWYYVDGAVEKPAVGFIDASEDEILAAAREIESERALASG